ncbi:MAG: AraC family transcriptional regulator [Flavobacteriales bacterium]|jgi:AraC-like DNA-binding protein
MKAFLEDIPSKKGKASFYSTKITVQSFEFKWHYHPEYELTYIVRGSGYRIVGNSHEHFASGDLVLLGSNLPHTWWGKNEDGSRSEAIVIQFSNEFIEPFLRLNEGHAIKALLESAAKGLRFESDDALVDKLVSIGQTKEMDSILSLLSILQDLTEKSGSNLCPDAYHNVISKKFETRINKVCTYIQNHYSERISLQQVSELVFMTESNFCKFFKKATSTTFSDYVNDLRINEACHLLIYSEDNISKIAQDCGFESLSYFNRVFLKKKRIKPSLFRKNASAIH